MEQGVVVIDGSIRGRPRCPKCRCKCPIYDTLPSRRWRHLDFGVFAVEIEAGLRRVSCREHGVLAEAVDFADPRASFTYAFEDVVTWLTQRLDKTSITKLMRINWRTVGGIVERVVARRREPADFTKLFAIGVDELSYRKGHHYLTLVTDLEKGRVIWSKEGRSSATFGAFLDEIGAEARAALRYVSMDMSEAFRKAVVEHVPHAKIVYDRFHVVRLLNDAVDAVRRELWRSLRRGSPEASAMKGTRFVLLKRSRDATTDDCESLARLQKANAPLYRGYLLKESFAGIYDGLPMPHVAAKMIRDWISWALRSRLKPFRKVAKTIRGHFEGILEFFHTGYTNALPEGFNNKARLAVRQAYGFHSAKAVAAAIELRCFGLVIPLPFAA